MSTTTTDDVDADDDKNVGSDGRHISDLPYSTVPWSFTFSFDFYYYFLQFNSFEKMRARARVLLHSVITPEDEIRFGQASAGEREREGGSEG